MNEEWKITKCDENYFEFFSKAKTKFQMNIATIKKPTHQIYGLFRIEILRKYFHYFAEDESLHYFDESRFVHKVFSSENCIFVNDAFLNKIYHKTARSQMNTLRKKVLSFIVFTLKLLPLYISSNYSILEKIIIFIYIILFHALTLVRIILPQKLKNIFLQLTVNRSIN